MPKAKNEQYTAPKPARERSSRPIDAGRYCQKCGQEARIVSNQMGVTAYCGPCGTQWGISGPRFIPPDAVMLPRGLSKRSSVSMDTSIAYESDGEDQPYEPKSWEESDE